MVQKNCSGLILEALRIHTQQGSVLTAFSVVAFLKKSGTFADAFINGGMGLSIEDLPFVGLERGGA